MAESEPIHVFEPKNGPPGWCVSLRVSEEHRPIVCTSAGEGWARQVAADIQKFVDAAVAEATGHQAYNLAMAQQEHLVSLEALHAVDKADAVKDQRVRWQGACSACETTIAQVLGVDEPSSTDWVNLRAAMNLAASAIREGGAS